MALAVSDRHAHDRRQRRLPVRRVGQDVLAERVRGERASQDRRGIGDLYVVESNHVGMVPCTISDDGSSTASPRSRIAILLPHGYSQQPAPSC